MDERPLVWHLFEGVAPLATADAFSRLYARTHLHVFRYINGLSDGSLAEAEDLTADTFLRAWHSRYRFRGDEDAALSWLLTIARRLVSNRRRQQRQRTQTPLDALLDVPANEPSLDDHTVAQEHLRLVRALVAQLPDAQRELLVLRYGLDWRITRIATHVGMTENTVAVTIRRTLQRLRHTWLHDQEKP